MNGETKTKYAFVMYDNDIVLKDTFSVIAYTIVPT